MSDDEGERFDPFIRYSFSVPETDGSVERKAITINLKGSESPHRSRNYQVPTMLVESVHLRDYVWTMRYATLPPAGSTRFGREEVNVEVRGESLPTFQRLTKSIQLAVWLQRGVPDYAHDKNIRNLVLDLMHRICLGTISTDEAILQSRVALEEATLNLWRRSFPKDLIRDMEESLHMLRHELWDWPSYLRRVGDRISRAGFQSEEETEHRVQMAREHNHPNFFAPVNNLDLNRMARQRREVNEWLGGVMRKRA